VNERGIAGSIFPFRGVWPTIAPSAYIAPGAVIIGDVTIDEEVAILSHAVLRGDAAPIVVGRGSNVQDSATVHADVGFPTRIGAYVVIGHNAIVHGATIEDICLIGMHATVLNGARIGTGSIIGAAALIAEGTAVPARTLMLGVPAKPRRELSDEEVARIRDNAQSYIDLSRTYLASGMGRLEDTMRPHFTE
jgi:carbonic anhydrase/acetyltransferase-like protein (isoleucine patch superfamily)